MDAAHVFRQGLGTVAPRQNHAQAPSQPPIDPATNDGFSDGDAPGHRVAHTLTACCRCRQRKTRCDPTLPRCLPCERSGSTCEYLDTTKGRKINRYYVIKLQDKVRALEAELGQYTDEESEYPRSNEDMVRPGGMIRLSASDDTPRYLGPSSGIAMTRLLMEGAKRFTESNRISDLIPEVRARNQARMQSIQMTGPAATRKKSYPMVSENPVESLPTRAMADRLSDIYTQKAQLFWPALHQKDFEEDKEAVYNGDTDPYKNFVLCMVIAVSLQKLDTQYAGLADGYYLAAMKHVEAVIRPKDLKTVQCLILIGQYSLLTPTRTPVYYVIGLAMKICQQEGLTDEQTITTGYKLDSKTLDLRRRLVWIVTTMEFGLSYYMGRPSAFATETERMDVAFFAAVDDEFITENGIQSAPPSERKLMTIHLYKMRDLQTEIRRALYEKKRPEPKNDSHPWYQNMEDMLKDWLEKSPENPSWCKGWLTGYYHQMLVSMYRPSPQVPQPSPQAAVTCFDSSAFIITLSKKQMDSGFLDVTWVFLLTLNMALNALLWSTSYPEVRQLHSRQQVEELVNTSLDCFDQCAERWPGTASASQLYVIFSKACLQSYEEKGTQGSQPLFSFASPPSIAEQQSSPESYAQSVGSQQQQQPIPYLNPPNFGYVFDSPPESMNTYTFDPNYPPPQPTFRSNSIFENPATTDSNGRRFSYFPPDFSQSGDGLQDNLAQSTTSPEQSLSSPPDQIGNQLPTPPESLPRGNMSATTPSGTLSPPGMPPQLANIPDPLSGPPGVGMHTNMSPPQKPLAPQLSHPQQQRAPVFTVPRASQPLSQQRPLPVPTSTNDWFTPAPPFVSPFNFESMSNSFFNDAMPTFADSSNGAGSLALPQMGPGMDNLAQFNYLPGRQGSLTHSQQLELMNVLETEGVGDIDAFLNAGNVSDGRWY